MTASGNSDCDSLYCPEFESEFPEAVKTVRVHVSRIRAALEDPDALVTTPAGFPSTMPDDVTLACARYQGVRLARFAALLAPGRLAVSGAPGSDGAGDTHP